MKKLYMLTLLLANCYAGNAQYKGERLVIEDRLLTWDDFRGRHKSEQYDAVTDYMLDFEPRDVKPTDPVPQYKASGYFIPKESTVSRKFLKEHPDTVQTHVLKHEQGHYDLARIAARELNAMLAGFNYNPKRSVWQADSMYRSVNTRLRQLQVVYDRETNHSRIYDQQSRWEKLIADGLVNGKLPQ